MSTADGRDPRPSGLFLYGFIVSGTHHLTSLIADLSSMSTMRKELAMAHTTWIDSCCRILQEEQEYATDAYVLALVNVRCLVQSVGERFSYDDPSLVRFQSGAAVQMALNGLKKEAEKLGENTVFSPTHNNCEFCN